MTISFPVTCPTTLKPSAVRWSSVTAVTISRSQTSYQTTKYEYDGEAWQIEVSYPPLTRAEAAPFHAFLASLRGQNGTFLFGDTLLGTPQGTATGTPRVNGANQNKSKELVTDGWSNNTLVLKAGDFFQVDNSLYMVLADVTSNGSGQATIDIFPKARVHADNALLVTTNPKGVFRLATDETAVVEAPQNQFYNVSFRAVEDI